MFGECHLVIFGDIVRTQCQRFGYFKLKTNSQVSGNPPAFWLDGILEKASAACAESLHNMPCASKFLHKMLELFLEF